MKVFRSSFKARSFCKKGSAITMGNYDGLHLGHRAILKRLILEAKRRRVPAVVYTFEPHPVKLFAPQAAPALINTLEQKIELLEDCGIDAVVVETFDRKFSQYTPSGFFQKIICNHLKARYILVGYDFTFGARRQGNIETLERLGFEASIDVEIMDACMKKETLASSTLVRKYIQSGRIQEANALLTRSFFIDGVVVKGKGRGSTIGIPTANLKTSQELLPPPGVYVTETQIGNKKVRSATNIGHNPTFGTGSPQTIETHLLNYTGNLYRKKIRIHFLNRIREEKTFTRAQELVKQIQKDIAQAKKFKARLQSTSRAKPSRA